MGTIFIICDYISNKVGFSPLGQLEIERLRLVTKINDFVILLDMIFGFNYEN